VRVSCLCVNLS